MGWATYAVPPTELAQFTETFARRMANIDNDMLMYSKRSVNRQYEAMGIRQGIMSGTDVEAMSKHRPAAQDWNKRLREQGLKAALEWRDGPFRDFRGAQASAPHDRPIAGRGMTQPARGEDA
jgi:enoyl-CoA hydratase